MLLQLIIEATFETSRLREKSYLHFGRLPTKLIEAGGELGVKTAAPCIGVREKICTGTG